MERQLTILEYMAKQKEGIISDKALEKEEKRYEKIQRAIEKKDFKFLERCVKNFGEGKDEWCI